MTDIEKIVKEARKVWKVKDDEELSIQEVVSEFAYDNVHSKRTDQRRWYDVYEYVCQIGDLYVMFEWYEMTGDSCMGDMGLKFDEDTVYIVEKRTRTITETYYA